MVQTVTGSKNLKKAAAITALLAMFVQPTAAFASGIVNPGDAKGKNVYFGNFWQSYKTTGATINRSDGLDASNFNKEALKWQVLDTQDGNLTLLTSQAVVGTKQVKWNAQDSYGNNWENSNARAYLNGLNGNVSGTQPCNSDYRAEGKNFLTQAFTETEQKYIKETENKTYSDDAGTAELCTTQDKIFLLSRQEVQDTTGTYMNTSAERKTSATDYAYSWGAWDNNSSTSRTAGQSAEAMGATRWFLRSPSPDYSDSARAVNENGVVGRGTVSSNPIALRPALNLDSSKILFLSAAESGAVGSGVGKGGVAAGAGFALADYTGTDYKVTLKDTIISAPTVTAVTQTKTGGVDDLAAAAGTGGTVDLTSAVTSTYGNVKVSYTGKDGNADFVSAIVAGSDGNYSNYAKISAQAAETDKAVGISNLAEGDYKMYIFAEKVNGDKLTDYASALSSAYDIHAGSVTKYEGTLSSSYKDSGLTINLDNGFDLAFDNAAYDSKVNIGANGATLTADATNGTTINGDITFNGNATLNNSFTFGGNMNFNTALTITANKDVTAKGNLNFYLSNAPQGSTIVTMTGAKMDVSSATINLYQKSDTALYEKGTGVTLIAGATGYAYTKDNPKTTTALLEGGGLTTIDYNTYLEGTNLMAISNAETAPDADVIAEIGKPLSEGVLAAAAALTGANDMMADAGMDAALSAAAVSGATGAVAFASVQGSHGRYQTGSYVDLNKTQVAAGLAKRFNDSTTAGIFIEGGNGRYSSYNTFSNPSLAGYGELRADGDINYFGGGIFAHYAFKATEKGNAYIDGAFGAGHANEDYATENYLTLGSVRYDTSMAYLKAHATVGYDWKLAKGGKIDTYLKYLWTHQNGDTAQFNGGEVDFDAINSHRLRAGFRYAQDIKKAVAWYGGLAYEYEFDATASATSNGYKLGEPSLKGGSGMAELGLKFKPTKENGWNFDAGLQGFTGKRDTLGVRLGAWYEF